MVATLVSNLPRECLWGQWRGVCHSLRDSKVGTGTKDNNNNHHHYPPWDTQHLFGKLAGGEAIVANGESLLHTLSDSGVYLL